MLIVTGAGQAAARLVQHLRAGGFADDITLVGDELQPPYERPPLSKEGLTDPGAAVPTIHSQSFYDQGRVRVLLGVRVERIDRAARRIELSNGDAMSYAKLVLATGSRARKLDELPIGQNIVSLRTYADAERLRNLLGPQRRLLIVGGGFLGLEAASSARLIGTEVIVAEGAARLLPRILPSELSASLQRLHQDRGIQFIFGARVESVTRLGGPQKPPRLEVRVQGRQPLIVNGILVAVGGIPNDDIARVAGLRVQDGVICDCACRTSDPDILAIGDCARVANRYEAAPPRYESWQAAESQAVVAADTLLGRTSRFDEVPWFWTDQAGINLQLLGRFDDSNLVVRGDPNGRSWIALQLNGQVIRAAALFNCGRDRRPIAALMKARTPVRVSSLADETVPLRALGDRHISD